MTKLAFKKLFIANRGEVCKRIASTAKRLGLQTATVLVDDEPPAFLSGLIDSFAKANPEVANPYLSIEEMVRLCKETGSQAVHPGFGFLSENDDFARAVINAGLIWIGPNPDSIKAMASKASARDLAVSSKVPVNQALQGVELRDEAADLKRVHDFVAKAGLPVLVKAAFGGGGKGMRLVEDKSKLDEAVLRCHSEAKSSFGNGQLLVETYIKAPRHVEVQILGDKHGNVYAIGDRDCSVQRRHQKIIEEAPAPCLNAQTRREMHEAAVSLAKKVGYDSAGTVEFLVDAAVKDYANQKQSFYFLEMNTRLQVEHPVTEEVYGIDLVEWQLRVASKESLPNFKTIEPRGWSIETRVYAEDCENNFLPSPMRVDAFLPHYDLGIRWEVGIDRTDVVSAKFDPMIAKCIATGPTREAAMDRLAGALSKTMLAGPKHNMEFVRIILEHKSFREGGVSTHFIPDNLKDLMGSWQAKRDAHSLDAKHLIAFLSNEGGSDQKDGRSIDDLTFRSFGAAQSSKPSSSDYLLRERSNFLHQKSSEAISIQTAVVIDKKHTDRAILYARAKELDGVTHWLSFDGTSYSDKISRGSLTGYGADAAGDDEVKAPVPGKIVSVKTTAGSDVKKGDVILVLESMKMEFEIKSSRNGVIQSILIGVGQQVNAGQTLATWQQS